MASYQLLQSSINAAPLTDFEFELLDGFQKKIPLAPKPFLLMAEKLKVNEREVIDSLDSLHSRGFISRVGAVLRPHAIGASALVAISVNQSRLNEVADLVSNLDAVNHNYEREHYFNLWFVIAGESFEYINKSLKELENKVACGLFLVLPLVEQFHIDLGFSLKNRGHVGLGQKIIYDETLTTINLSEVDKKLMYWMQGGLRIVSNPFENHILPVSNTLETIEKWIDSGVIKRFAVIVRHHELGFNANAMVVWDVPDSEVSYIGKRIALSGLTSLCYRRPRRLPDWPYNLFCMIHGKSRHEVEDQIESLSKTCGLLDFRREILFSKKRYKQCGAKYIAEKSVSNG
jgi:DNA-binding Lrp family transcriptional regulator